MPPVVVVWARPELSRRWVMEELRSEGLITHVLERGPVEGERDGCATTHPESHSIRQGLDFIKAEYGETHFAIMQGADIWVKPGMYRFLTDRMNEQENSAVLFFMPNGVVHRDCFHTNFFAVPMDEIYWPPLAKKEDQDMLERKWGLQLKENKVPDILIWHNNWDKSFIHAHESENQPAEERRPFRISTNVVIPLKAKRRTFGVWLLRKVGLLWQNLFANSTR